ncbi:hypothetical protein C3L57_01335 [Veillonellaceae bacterium M2-8]|uniref:hypothetical protein n=1 Tax=uncultured Megasphaera sp. TaxID=165188 RepID=UPI0012E1B104|nr:hypothetical protein [uncultured Megasphaera sp.]MUP47876.1 hypothetical protein [Veillonellaceae bacterium M2-8]
MEMEKSGKWWLYALLGGMIVIHGGCIYYTHHLYDQLQAWKHVQAQVQDQTPLRMGVFPPASPQHLVETVEEIAQSLHMNILRTNITDDGTTCEIEVESDFFQLLLYLEMLSERLYTTEVKLLRFERNDIGSQATVQILTEKS